MQAQWRAQRFYLSNRIQYSSYNTIPVFKATPFVTPITIVPEWYLVPLYAILRAIPLKLGGIIAMAGAFVFLVGHPFLLGSHSRRKAIFPGVYLLWLILENLVILGNTTIALVHMVVYDRALHIGFLS